MARDEAIEEVVETLQQLGLKEYEARCFAGLSQVNAATAKQLGEQTEVPRTRVYDAIRVLEVKGLVEIHHSSPQRYRAVPLDEAIETIRDEHEALLSRFRDAMGPIERVDIVDESVDTEVWTLSGRGAIDHRTIQLVAQATEEVVLVLGDESLATDELLDDLDAASGQVPLRIGTPSDSVLERVDRAVPAASTSGTELLPVGEGLAGSAVIGRLLLVDHSIALVSTLVRPSEQGEEEEAVIGQGAENGLVVMARLLLDDALPPA